MGRRLLLVCVLVVSMHAIQSNAQLPRLPNPFRRGRLAARAGAAQEPQAQAAAPDRPAAPSSDGGNGTSGSSARCGGSGWTLAAAGAEGSELPASTDRVLICLISTGVHREAPQLQHNRWTGCAAQDPLDPTGCTLPWATSPAAPGFKPRGTWAAALMAAKEGGLIPGGADIHVVPVDGPASGSLDPASLAPYGKSRLRAYSVCEGRLRGLQAQDWSGGSGGGPRKRWRMVMLVDVTADKAAATGSGEFALGEGDWVAAATGPGGGEAQHPPDVLVVAPAGNRPDGGAAYPAALPRVVGVGAAKCNGEPAQAAGAGDGGKPDLLAPGVNVAVPGADKAWSDSTAAAALVAGAAARLWSAYPRCNANAVREALLAGSGGGAKAGPPRLNLQAAEAALRKLSCATQRR